MYNLNSELKYSTANQTSSEIAKSIKNEFCGASRPEYDCKTKVRRRTDTNLSFVRGDDEWKRTLDRREDQKSKGFFSQIAVPYDELGKIELGCKELVVKALKDIGGVFKTQPGQDAIDEEINNEIPKEKGKTEKETKEPLEKEVPEIHDSGSSTIKELLSRAERRMKFVKAGRPLSQYLREEGKQQAHLKLKQKELQDQSSSGVFHLETPNEFIKEVDDLDPIDGIRRPQDSTQKKAFLAKLQFLEMIFCSVWNTKNKDLRSKMPLSRETLRSIRRTVSLEGPQGMFAVNRQPRMSAVPAIIFASNRNHRLHSSSVNESETTPALPATTTAYRISNPVYLDDNQSVSSRVLLGSNETHVAKPLPASLHASKNLVHLTASASPSRFSQPYSGGGGGCLRMETWDDLMAMQAESFRCDDSVTDADGRSGRPGQHNYSHMIRLLKPRRGAVFQSKGSIDLPIWQRVIQDEMKREEIKQGRKVKDFKKKQVVNGDAMLEEVKKTFIKTKDKSSVKLERDLEFKLDCFKERMNYLKVSLFAEEDFKHMRSMMRHWQMALAASNARPAKWYETLCNDQKSYGLAHDAQVSSKVKDLFKFTKVDVTSIVNIKAKLCLLVMSFPVYELCQSPMQEALKFFLEYIMEKSPNHLEDWMLHRKLFV